MDMFLLWSICSKQKTAALHSSLGPRLGSLPAATEAFTSSEHLVTLSIRKEFSSKSVNNKDH